jgi:hypothetical protein
MAKKKEGVSVEGIVARRDNQPYIKLFKDSDPIAQMSMAQARNFAHDILNMCARTEADAMIHKFFAAQHFPEDAGAALMLEFRNFRYALDSEEVGKWVDTPSEDPPVN